MPKVVFKPHFHHLSTTSRQEIHRLLHRESAANPRVFRIICTYSSRFRGAHFSFGFAELFRKRLADSAGEIWRKVCGSGPVAEKRVAGLEGLLVAGFSSWCTARVARGTIVKLEIS